MEEIRLHRRYSAASLSPNRHCCRILATCSRVSLMLARKFATSGKQINIFSQKETALLGTRDNPISFRSGSGARSPTTTTHTCPPSPSRPKKAGTCVNIMISQVVQFRVAVSNCAFPLSSFTTPQTWFVGFCVDVKWKVWIGVGEFSGNDGV